MIVADTSVLIGSLTGAGETLPALRDAIDLGVFSAPEYFTTTSAVAPQVVSTGSRMRVEYDGA